MPAASSTRAQMPEGARGARGRFTPVPAAVIGVPSELESWEGRTLVPVVGDHVPLVV